MLDAPISPAIQSILDELDEDLSPPPTPESSSAAAAAARRADADRKRAERATRRGAGFPDGRSIDLAIAGALVDVLRENSAGAVVAKRGTLDKLGVKLKPIVEGALRTLVAKGVRPDIALRAVQHRMLQA